MFFYILGIENTTKVPVLGLVILACIYSINPLKRDAYMRTNVKLQFDSREGNVI